MVMARDLPRRVTVQLASVATRGRGPAPGLKLAIGGSLALRREESVEGKDNALKLVALSILHETKLNFQPKRITSPEALSSSEGV